MIKKDIQLELPPFDQDVVFHLNDAEYVGYLTMYCWEEQILKIALYGKLADQIKEECYDGADNRCQMLDVDYWRELAENERKDGE
jgi:hypothetical protein